MNTSIWKRHTHTHTHTLYLESGNSLGTVAYHLFNILVMDNHTNDIYKVSMVMVNKPLCFVKR